ncbi:hypothetical protein EXIGLDRAFT_749967 [Exidia glandulosa HHB12029]|uniref:DUF6535 domain-containing protein n=1 Tax=Exidia glandulosa HHB12029 TaxID=1314781 RepID=A0A165HDS2_EXIGL|nr:hypothetical protein EXIGLDRAFT_749967 [Exidia glandulosa HHB12029]
MVRLEQSLRPRLSDDAEQADDPPRHDAATANLQWRASDIDAEFNHKHPPDEFGNEMGPEARFWKVHRKEATTHDKMLLHGWHKTLDILLLFAALFSAVVTAFIVDTYKLLRPLDASGNVADPEVLRRATSSPRGGPLSSDLGISLGRARWLNGVWFTSLIFAVTSAFLAILVKQWLDAYSARTTGAGVGRTTPMG